MNSRLTLILVALLLLLGGYVYFFELKRDEANNDITAEAGFPLYDTEYGEYDIVEMKLASPRGSARFARTDDSAEQAWAMLSPDTIPPDRLDQVRVNGAAFRMGKLTANQVITDVTNLAQYGLSSPGLTTTLTISNGQEIIVYAGAPAPVGGSRYVRTTKDDQTVYLVFDFAIEDLLRLIEEPPLKSAPVSTSVTPSP